MVYAFHIQNRWFPPRSVISPNSFPDLNHADMDLAGETKVKETAENKMKRKNAIQMW